MVSDIAVHLVFMPNMPYDISMKNQTLADNKRGLFSYEVLEKYQAGIKLSGPEVKAIKKGSVNLLGSFVSLKQNPQTRSLEAWLMGTHIGKYAPAASEQKTYNPLRPRKLLLTKKEILELAGKTSSAKSSHSKSGLTILPISVYTSNRLVKLEIALTKGKKKYDKREAIKTREFTRRKQRMLK